MSTILASRQEIIERIRRLTPQLRALGVMRLALFGSFVRDAQHPASDVDLLVGFAPGRKTFDNFTATCDLLEDSLGRPVELVTFESLSPYIGPHILREAEDVIVSA
jgi:predicted nucleotidyltransferase